MSALASRSAGPSVGAAVGGGPSLRGAVDADAEARLDVDQPPRQRLGVGQPRAQAVVVAHAAARPLERVDLGVDLVELRAQARPLGLQRSSADCARAARRGDGAAAASVTNAAKAARRAVWRMKRLPGPKQGSYHGVCNRQSLARPAWRAQISPVSRSVPREYLRFLRTTGPEICQNGGRDASTP